ncbi:uncharacterized protein [Rutidosis leptorrhynchoides]|uniref:uncharacterized protein n=1 Tax=Rutidosis leptorrhynchoides TaxID=125765 RepID=UPI003A995FF3
MGKDGTSSSITEQDVSLILQRYRATSIIGLLEEVGGQVEDVVKIDWNALVKNTKTGITNPREYQMLWRHLAYSHPLLHHFEPQAQPLDDDSDLECELEAFPTVSNEASAEAAAFVKVLMGSGSSNELCLEKGLIIEAPLTINIPRTKSTQHQHQHQHQLENTECGGSTNISGVNISVPVYVPTQVLPTVVSAAAEGLDSNNNNNNNNLGPLKRKRNPWSAEEDRELFAAVQRFGEGNWATMLKGDFKTDRTASQLSQRWNIIKKRQRYLSLTSGGSQLSEGQLATRRAIHMALDKPRLDTPKVASSQGWTNTGNLSIQKPTTVGDALLPQRAGFVRHHQQQQQQQQAASFTGSSSSRCVVGPGGGSDAVKAAAVAAGARIATHSVAAALILEQQQLQMMKTTTSTTTSVIHIKTTTPPPPPSHVVAPHHMGGSDYCRSILLSSSNTPRGSSLVGSSHSITNNANAVPPVVGQLKQGSMGHEINGSSQVKDEVDEVKHSNSSSAHSPESIQQDNKAIGLLLVSKHDEKEEEEKEQQPPPPPESSSNQLNTILKSEGQS